MAIVTGTFSATGNSDAIVAGKVMVDMTFSGTATVAIQWQVDGTNWRTIESATASTQKIVDAGGVPVRLSCTAYTNSVAYALRSV